MTFESITEIWTYWLNEMSLESITEGLTYFNQRYDVWEHYRNLNVLHSTMCPLRALQKSELIALNEMSLVSITGRWSYCTQRYVVWEHYRNLNLLHSRYVVWEHYRLLKLLLSTSRRLRALQKSELIALNDMSFESITEIWTYCTQRDVVWEHYRNLNLLHSTRYRLRALQKSELIANDMSFESITEASELIALNEMLFKSITEIWTYCTQRDVVWEHYRNLNLLHSTICRLRALQKSELID